MLGSICIACLAGNGMAIGLVAWRGRLAIAAPRGLSNAIALLFIAAVACDDAVAMPPGFARRSQRVWGNVLSLCHTCLCPGVGGVYRGCNSPLLCVLLDFARSIAFLVTPVCLFVGVVRCRPEAVIGDVFSLVKAIMSFMFISSCIWFPVRSLATLDVRSFAVPPRMG